MSEEHRNEQIASEKSVSPMLASINQKNTSLDCSFFFFPLSVCMKRFYWGLLVGVSAF